jgi:hypothetical protein
MAVNYTTAVANARLEAVRAALNAGGGGDIVLQTAGGAVDLCSVPLDASIGAPASKVLTVISAPKQGSATVQGAAAAAKLVDGSGTTVASGLTVGTSGSDVNLNDVNLLVGSQVTLNSGTITTP